MTPPLRMRALDVAGLLGLPTAVAAGCAALAWLAGFGETTAPDALPWAELAFFGALFGDYLAHALSRQRVLGAVAAALGFALAVAVVLLSPLPERYLAAPAAMGALGLLGAALPAPRNAMVGAMSVYIASTLLANYTFDAFLPLGDWFLVNVGTLFFGITFTQRDRVHRFGRRAVYAMIVGAAAANVVVALSVGTPLRYVAVAFLAIVVSESADTEIYARLLGRRWLSRVASSNAVSVPLDTVVFTTLAFTGASFATFGWMVQVIVTDVLVKYASSMATALGLIASRAPVVDTLEP